MEVAVLKHHHNINQRSDLSAIALATAEVRDQGSEVRNLIRPKAFTRYVSSAFIWCCLLIGLMANVHPAFATISSNRYYGGSGDGWDMKQISPTFYQGGAEDGSTLASVSPSNSVLEDVSFYEKALHVLGQLPETVYAGTPFAWGPSETPLSIEVLDNKGRRYSNTVFTVTLLLKNAEGSTLGGTTNVLTVNGVATFENAGLFINNPGTGLVIEATAETLDPADSSAFTVQDIPAAPDAPTGVNATDGTLTNKVLVTWSTSGNATGYQLWRYTNNISANASQIGSATSAPYEDASVTANITYYYWVKATNVGGASAFSAWNTGWGAPTIVAPSAPTGVSASDGDYTNKVCVTWNAADGATGYQVWRHTADSSGDASQIGVASSTTYDDANAVAGTTYYYWLKATNSVGVSGFGSSDSGWRAVPVAAPSIPTDISASDGAFTGRVHVVWSAVSGATGYQVFRNTVNLPSRADLIGTSASADYDDREVAGSGLYYYWVKATNIVGASGFSVSDTGWGMPAETAPSAPAGVSASDGTYTNKIVVTWNAVDGAVDYQVWRNTADDSASASLLSTTAALTCDDSTAVAAGVKVYYWVKARNSLGSSVFSQSDSGYCGVSGTADLALRGFLFQPTVLAANAHPKLIMLMPVNNGPEVLAGSEVTFEFFLSRNTELGDADDEAIGSCQATVSIDAGASASVSIPAAGLAGITVPAEASGTYYVFARVAAAFSDPDASNNVLMRTGAIVVGGNLQPMAGDFDGDGKSDPALYQEATGDWYVKSSVAGYTLATLTGFGQAGYTPISADYDGDGKTDPAAYDLATGLLYVKLSASGYAQASYSFSFNGYGYLLATGDYDGGGKADLALYQEATHLWTVLLVESVTLATLEFGADGCQPLVGDYDGDGKNDPALYQETSGNWFVKLSGSEYVTVEARLGGPGYQPVSGDYDGDGKADLMVYREATGSWLAMLSASAYAAVSMADFGGLDYMPVAGDYDGDGKADLVLYNQATSTWFFKLSASGYSLLTSPF